VPKIVESLIGHPARERAVADDGDDAAIELAREGERARDAVRVAKRSRSMAVLDPVMGRLGAVRIAREALFLAELGEASPPAREQLVDVGLVAGIEQQDVARRIEDAMERDGELDGAKVRTEVATGARDRIHDEAAALLSELSARLHVKASQVAGARDGLKARVGGAVMLVHRVPSPPGLCCPRRFARPMARARPGEGTGHRCRFPASPPALAATGTPRTVAMTGWSCPLLVAAILADPSGAVNEAPQATPAQRAARA
jgi:hypothetical protein